MRFNGQLTKWNNDRGFGFITARIGGKNIFVHISAFPRDGQRPILNEKISFEIETLSNGKTQAIKVTRLISPKKRLLLKPIHTQNNHTQNNHHNLLKTFILIMFVIVALITYIYNYYANHQLQVMPTSNSSFKGNEQNDSTTSETKISTPFECDGRIHCSQMTSCAEATYFLRNCPGVKMDGDDDRIPCEDQWCGF